MECYRLEIANRYSLDGFTLVYLRNSHNDVELELTINHDRTEPYSFGDAFGHLAVAVPGLGAEHARLGGAGIKAQPIKEFFRNDVLIARFFFIQDPDGYKIEVPHRHGHYV